MALGCDAEIFLVQGPYKVFLGVGLRVAVSAPACLSAV